MIENQIAILPLKSDELNEFWQLAFSNPTSEWTKWNGSYFHNELSKKETFLTTIGPQKWSNNPNRKIWHLEK